jgi:phosphohistidine phosphatase
MSMELYLVRHAIAAGRDSRRWPEDRDRPLTGEGIRKFRDAVHGIIRLVPQVDVLWSSPYRRAWETARILHDEGGWPEPQELEQLEPGGSVDALLRFLAAHDKGRVAVVGHAPHLDELAALALSGRADLESFALRKGAVARVDFGAEARLGEGRLAWLLQPKFLRSLAE